MKPIIYVLSIIGIIAGAIGIFYFSMVKIVIDRCGGAPGIEGGISVCQTVYGISPLLYFSIGVFVLSIVALLVSIRNKGFKLVH